MEQRVEAVAVEQSMVLAELVAHRHKLFRLTRLLNMDSLEEILRPVVDTLREQVVVVPVVQEER
jgi:hypothetical protein